MQTLPIERRTGLSREEFIHEYQMPKKPVVMTDLTKDWPATEKWTFEFLIHDYGHLDVPVIGPEFHQPGPNYMKSTQSMKLGDYLQLIQAGPTPLRIFAWNIFDHAPELRNDVADHHIWKYVVKRPPFLFFGGAGAATPLHYDIDCPNNLHTHFQTRKHIVLFPPTEGRRLYQHLFTVQSQVNPLDLDRERFPAAEYAEAHECILEHGETLYIPSLWWHYIKYVDGGYSITLGSYEDVGSLVRGVWNLSRHFVVDKAMNALWGQGWKDWKQHAAERRAVEAA